MIKRIRIKGYKSFRDFELKMKPLMILFGPNASGKSNLFDALNLIGKIVTEKNLQDAFEHHRGLAVETYFRGGDKKDTEKSHLIEFEVDLELSNLIVQEIEKEIEGMLTAALKEGEKPKPKKIHERNLRYQLCLRIDSTGSLSIIDENLSPIKSNGEKKKSREPFIGKMGDKIRLRMEGQARPKEYDVGLDHSIVSERPYLPYYPHINAFYREASNWRFYYLDPKTLMREDAPIKATEYIGSIGDGLADFYYFLKDKNPPQFDNLELVLHSLIPSIEKICPDRVEQGVVRLYLSEKGMTISSKVLSEGTIRMLGILAIMGSPKKATLIGYEEPENGVHPGRLKKVADIFRNKADSKECQILINSHSAEFVSFFSDNDLFVCRKRNRQTEIVPLKHEGALFRRTAIKEGLADLSEEP